ncbi:ROK family protein [Acetivibrio cellulolyticus]|uniref:ROK family protein n=1 Tax=Acetivibrio cellulolyticus TaxID=35830 RepID=UPI0001E30579|nr:ROK family protein [Acetivibrio cellulolyticus]
MGKKHICLDIGGTKVLGAILDEKDNITFKVKKKTKVDKGLEKVEERIIDVVDELIKESGTDKNEIAAIGAGAPGVINEETGEIIYAPNLPWKNYDIKKVMEKRFGIPFYIGNDANMGMLGEWKYGMAVKKENVVGIFVGTGVGGGLIINNKLFTGKRHDAGELGHMSLNTEGPYCNCGQRGCLEAYASKISITREIKVQIERGRKTILKDLLGEDSIIKSKDLKEAIDAKDSLALEVMDRAVYYLAAGTGNLINIFGPDMVVLGGGVLESLGDFIMPRVKDYVKRFTLPEILNGTEIVRSALGDDAIIYGSLAIIKGKKG